MREKERALWKVEEKCYENVAGELYIYMQSNFSELLDKY